MGNFYTDVIRKDPRFKSVQVVDDMALLEPVTRKIVKQIIADAAEAGVKLMVYETYRSQARQTKLYKKGATKLETVGVHHYGLACDLVRNIGGEPSWKGDFKIVGKLAKKYKMIWGGVWKFRDEYHVQRCTVARQKSLFSGAWYPDEDYDPYK